MKQARNYTNEGGSNANYTERRDLHWKSAWDRIAHRTVQRADEEDHASVRTTLAGLARERMGTSM